MKKYTGFVTCLLLVSMLPIGCTGNGDERNSTQANLQQSTESQDVAWVNHLDKYTQLINSDIQNVGMAANVSDYNLLKEYGQDLVNDSQSALDENSKYTISPQYQRTQTEWVKALTDLNSAGKYIVISADESLAYGVPVRNLDYEKKSRPIPSQVQHI